MQWSQKAVNEEGVTEVSIVIVPGYIYTMDTTVPEKFYKQNCLSRPLKTMKTESKRGKKSFKKK